MEKVKKYEKIVADIASLGSKIVGYEEDIKKLTNEFEPLEEEMIKLEILGDPSFERKKVEVKKNTEKRHKLKNELEDARKKQKVMMEIKASFRDEARLEMERHYKKIFEEKFKSFFSELKKVQKLEFELEALREESRQKYSKIGASISIHSIPKWESLLTEKRPYSNSPDIIEEFMWFLKQNYHLDIS